MLEEPKKEEPKQEELLKRLQAELREFEEHARFKQNLAERKMVGTGRLLSYEEGFSWCSECKFVSGISPQSDLKPRGLRGCQRPSCQKCFQWKEPVVYHDEDFLYEGDKEQKDCKWYVSGHGCEDGNKCLLNHPKWDESLPENVRRCYVCGQRRDHTSKHCERPGGGEEGAEVMTVMEGLFYLSNLPKRPNGESVMIPPPTYRGPIPHQAPYQAEIMARRQETPEERERKQIQRMIEQARKDLIARVSISANFREVLTNLARRIDDYPEKEEVQEIYEAMLIQERVQELQREANERRNIEILRLMHEERQEIVFPRNDEDDEEQPPQIRPRINTIKVLKVDLEEEEESDSKWLKHFLLTISAQVIIQFLYGSCSRRRREQKEKITEDESKSGGDESFEDDEEEEFEFIQGETVHGPGTHHRPGSDAHALRPLRHHDADRSGRAHHQGRAARDRRGHPPPA